MRALLSATLLAVPALFLAAAQEPRPGDRPLPESHTSRIQERIDARRKAMQGAWRLTEMRNIDLPVDRRVEAGYCLVSGHYLSIELHWGYLNSSTRIERLFLATGTHRFTLDELGNAQLVSLIGSSLDERSFVVFEPPGTKREYRVTCEADQLVLENPSGSRFTFARVVDPTAEPERDIYGRPIPKPAKPEPKADGDG